MGKLTSEGYHFTMNRLFTGLWKHADFRKLWAGQTISLFGSQITLLALPVVATVTLHANALQMGVLRAASSLPTLLFGLLVGVWVDRVHRRRILISADLGRALFLVSIPIAAFLGLLGIGQLYIVAFVTGLLSLFFDVAHISLLPSLVSRKDLIEGNSKLELSRAGALITGPGVAGVLIQVVTAPFAIIVDVLSFLGSALFLSLIHTPEPAPPENKQPSSFWSDIRIGLRLVLRNPILRAISLSLMVFNFFLSMINALYVLYVIGTLGVSPAILGFIYTAGSIGFPIGVALAGRAARRLGVGPAIVWGAVLCDLPCLLIALAGGPLTISVPMLIAAQFLSTIGGPLTAINQGSLRQAITPDALQGRVNGTARFIGASMGPIGALIAGVLGEHIGLRPTLVLATIGIQTGIFLLLIPSILKFRGLSE
jgi:MFS family permease